MKWTKWFIDTSGNMYQNGIALWMCHPCRCTCTSICSIKRRQSNYNNFQVIIIQLNALILSITTNKATKWQTNISQDGFLRFYFELLRCHLNHCNVLNQCSCHGAEKMSPFTTTVSVGCCKSNGVFWETTLHCNNFSNLMGVKSVLIYR